MLRGILVLQKGEKGAIAQFTAESAIVSLKMIMYANPETAAQIEIITAKGQQRVPRASARWVTVENLDDLWEYEARFFQESDVVEGGEGNAKTDNA